MAGSTPAIWLSVDSQGNYYITGRAKEVIVLSSGKNIYPEEIESYYLQSPWIKDICVMGLESHKPGEPLSERLHGVIVPNFDLLRQKKIVNTREVIRYDIENISMSAGHDETHSELRHLARRIATHDDT